MKSELIDDTSQAKLERNFPCLRINQVGGFVVLFRNPYQGTVIVSGDNTFPVGYYSEYWVNYNNNETWKFCDKCILITP